MNVNTARKRHTRIFHSRFTGDDSMKTTIEIHCKVQDRSQYRLIVDVCFFLAAALFVAYVPATSYAAPGDLDPTFGIGGRIYPSVPSPNFEWAGGIAIQPDNKIIVSGSIYDLSTNVSSLALTRYLPNGVLDPTFGPGGRVFVANYSGGHIALQDNGKILLASGPHILRFLPNGSLDPDFDADGIVNVSAFDVYRLAVQNDGKIVAAGTKYPALFALARLNPDGTFDNSFGSEGMVTTAFPYPRSYLAGIAIQRDGKILASGSSFGEFLCDQCGVALARYCIDGSLDTSFGTLGRTVTPTPGYFGTDVTLQNDQKIVVAGHYSDSSGAGGIVTRYIPNGSLDYSFGTSGQASIPNLCPSSIAVQSDRNIVLAGTTTNYTSNSNHEIGRLLPNGVLDPLFGNNGYVTTIYPNWPQGYYFSGWIAGMAVQVNGKIVTAGSWSGLDSDGNQYWSYGTTARYIGGGSTTLPARSRADFDGDGRTDHSVYRPLDGDWYYQGSTAGFNAVHFGLSSDIPAPGDFDGDGRNDVGVYRNGIWYINASTSGHSAMQFGLGSDLPIPKSYIP